MKHVCQWVDPIFPSFGESIITKSQTLPSWWVQPYIPSSAVRRQAASRSIPGAKKKSFNFWLKMKTCLSLPGKAKNSVCVLFSCRYLGWSQVNNVLLLLDVEIALNILVLLLHYRAHLLGSKWDPSNKAAANWANCTHVKATCKQGIAKTFRSALT